MQCVHMNMQYIDVDTCDMSAYSDSENDDSGRGNIFNMLVTISRLFPSCSSLSRNHSE